MGKSLGETIRNIVKNYVDDSNPADYIYATIVSIGSSNCSIKLEKTGITIPSSMVDIPEGLSKKKIKIKIEGITYDAEVDAQLKAGDRVMVVKKLGGQKYAIIGKVS
ncbi:MAG: DUF2577 family protein [Anaerorhabdus sp.]|uniref:DUF2577 family protein n=1 Tax=Anaerorhabdus sp. TaxID=1872524 RepID=UPI003A84116A